jgi:hypothetical protein
VVDFCENLRSIPLNRSSVVPDLFRDLIDLSYSVSILRITY